MLAGDFNVVPTNADIYNEWLWRFDAVVQPETRAAYARLLEQGWIDATRQLHPDERIYTFWVERRRVPPQRGLPHGLPAAHAGCSPRLTATGVDSAHRGREKPSDHAPVWVQL